MTYKEIVTGTWKPENVDDNIEGVFIGVELDVGENKSKLYTIECDAKPTTIWGSAILDEKMAIVKPGDKIKITYLGKGEAKPGRNAPKLWKLERDTPDQEPDAQPVTTETF